MLSKNLKEQVQIIKKAYNRTVEDYNKGKSELEYLPTIFKNSERFRRLIKAADVCNSGDPWIKDYLNPVIGMNYLDVGSCANLIGYKLHEWQATYYGIDISQRLIAVTNSFVKTYKINIGGLFVAEIVNLPFVNNFFDITSAIGVLEYYEIDYNILAFKELNRVLKQNSKLVIDMPNEKHPDVLTLVEYETYLGRPRHNIPSKKEIIVALKKYFVIEDIDDSQLMLKYFLRNSK